MELQCVYALPLLGRHAPADADGGPQRGRAPPAGLRLRLHAAGRVQPGPSGPAQLRLRHVRTSRTSHLPRNAAARFGPVPPSTPPTHYPPSPPPPVFYSSQDVFFYFFFKVIVFLIFISLYTVMKDCFTFISALLKKIKITRNIFPHSVCLLCLLRVVLRVKGFCLMQGLCGKSNPSVELGGKSVKRPPFTLERRRN